MSSIIKQDYPKSDFEIIIVDGGSTDGTLEVVRKYINDLDIKIIHNELGIVSTGFNLGLNNALGNYIIRIDGHCEIPKNYIKVCYKILEEKKVDIVGGYIKTISNSTIGCSIAVAQSSTFGVGNVKFRNASLSNSSYVDTLAFGAHRRQLFYELGGYDEEMVCNQDDEFNYRVLQSGKKIWLESSLVTKYYSRTSFIRLFKQYFHYGFFKVRGIQKRSQIFSIRHLIPSLFIISSFITLISGKYFGLNWLSFSIILIYQLINIFSSIYHATKFNMVLLISISYWILHLSYGLGFLFGMIKFIFRWDDKQLRDYHFNRKIFFKNNTYSI